MKSISAKNLIPWICGAVLAVVLVLVSFLILRSGGPEKQGHHVVVFGDSIISYSQDDTSVVNMIIAKTGMDVFDLSFGGTQMALSLETETLGNKRNYLCMYSIAQSFYTGDFSMQESYVSMDITTDYFLDRIPLFETVDLAKTDIVIIEQCLNDYHSRTPITSDDGSEYSYTGAMTAVVSYMRSINPDIRIIILSPTMKWIEEGVEAEDYDFGSGTLELYLDAQRRTAEQLGVEYIDMTGIYDEEYITESGEVITGYGYTVDGTHPNIYGREAISDFISDYLKETEDDGK
ncbi:MAG: SGNH/GDSL hydrolase family protein [Lachnospiraceae bacterium]|nr:SGNH/GDSL hydrolase family protein [Lachnospiraceae bacterium]